MKERKLSVSITRKINLGNYESVDIFIGFSGEISDNDNHEEKYDEIFDIVEKQLEDSIDHLKDKHSK